MLEVFTENLEGRVLCSGGSTKEERGHCPVLGRHGLGTIGGSL